MNKIFYLLPLILTVFFFRCNPDNEFTSSITLVEVGIGPKGAIDSSRHSHAIAVSDKVYSIIVGDTSPVVVMTSMDGTREIIDLNAIFSDLIRIIPYRLMVVDGQPAVNMSARELGTITNCYYLATLEPPFTAHCMEASPYPLISVIGRNEVIIKTFDNTLEVRPVSVSSGFGAPIIVTPTTSISIVANQAIFEDGNYLISYRYGYLEISSNGIEEKEFIVPSGQNSSYLMASDHYVTSDFLYGSIFRPDGSKIEMPASVRRDGSGHIFFTSYNGGYVFLADRIVSGLWFLTPDRIEDATINLWETIPDVYFAATDGSSIYVGLSDRTVKYEWSQ